MNEIENRRQIIICQIAGEKIITENNLKPNILK